MWVGVEKTKSKNQFGRRKMAHYWWFTPLEWIFIERYTECKNLLLFVFGKPICNLVFCFQVTSCWQKWRNCYLCTTVCVCVGLQKPTGVSFWSSIDGIIVTAAAHSNRKKYTKICFPALHMPPLSVLFLWTYSKCRVKAKSTLGDFWTWVPWKFYVEELACWCYRVGKLAFSCACTVRAPLGVSMTLDCACKVKCNIKQSAEVFSGKKKNTGCCSVSKKFLRRYSAKITR